ncbi:heat shock factor-binding protein 1-like isoform X1 [Leptotrombidium deliense]|uniref:Heat shock factor-binding protein 1 n=1 Tax=Leptotrombidium deliense TaxID=299467 RepID=A0A443RVK1_9ACAR|nr:heat shock factor-binding protein 1-like isoform X1 [Leptotrombidium deliense]
METKAAHNHISSEHAENMNSTNNSSQAETKDVQDVTQFVQVLLQQVQDKFQAMSDQILNRIDEMGHRIDDLEHNLNELMQQAGISDEPQVIATSGASAETEKMSK